MKNFQQYTFNNNSYYFHLLSSTFYVISVSFANVRLFFPSPTEKCMFEDFNQKKYGKQM